MHIQRGYLGGGRGIGFIEEGPDLGLEALPPGERARVVRFLVPEHARNFLIAGALSVDVQLVQDGQGCLKHTLSNEM